MALADLIAVEPNFPHAMNLIFILPTLSSLHFASPFVPVNYLTSTFRQGPRVSLSSHRVPSILASVETTSYQSISDSTNSRNVPEWIVQWRGEGAEGYSTSLRQWEFASAFRAEVTLYLQTASDDGYILNQNYLDNIKLEFQDALLYKGPIRNSSANDDTASSSYDFKPIPLSQVEAYESAMQYVTISVKDDSNNRIGNLIYQHAILTTLLKNTVKRCSLVRMMAHIAAQGSSYEEAASQALDNGSFKDMMANGTNANATWSIRLRRYGSGENPPESEGGKNPASTATNKKKRNYQARYGKNVRSSLSDERDAILDLAELIQLFPGRVNLKKPDCKIYLLEGLRDGSVNSMVKESRALLARVIATGPKTSIYSPKTRICITTTPLCPIASFTLCNIAQILRHDTTTILDPFAGSCATLLAAAHITNSQCTSVGIEICHNGYVNRNDIQKDFESRELPPPLVIRGDCLSYEVRQEARAAINGEGFDVIVTDPPYGIREAMSSANDNEGDSMSPLTKLFQAMAYDRSIDKPLLKVGGRLVAFVPVRKGETLEECLPPVNVREDAGLLMDGEGKEQVLNDILSRWLVSFVCVR